MPERAKNAGAGPVNLIKETIYSRSKKEIIALREVAYWV